ncbi:IS1479 transposase [Xanthomonas bromi]|uniref:IS1479 transposase n=1 Tax=Xanthomonas bromi TaxID=56449 RepID=A0A1C3NL95_9XANT|nr:IS5 family transposase [Xanthomonas bromi]SBV51176.1 IS1479 transposase [Xanthomonas bromi]
MLRIHLLQHWYPLSDPAMEEALHEIPTLRRFAQLGGLDDVPDKATILSVRRLLETHQLAARMLDAVNAPLARHGRSLRAATIIDATLTAAPSSTKNADHARDPAMHQTRRGNQGHLGTKAHIGVDEFRGVAPGPLHGCQYRRCHGDARVAAWQGRQRVRHSSYIGAAKREELQARKAAFFIAARPSTIQGIGNKRERAREQRWEYVKASVRAKVKHPFRVIKRQFDDTKGRYRGWSRTRRRSRPCSRSPIYGWCTGSCCRPEGNAAWRGINP